MIRMWIWMHPFAKRSKMVCLIITWRELGQSPKRGHSALQKFRMVLLDAERAFVFRCVLGFFDPVLVPRRVFILSLWFFFISFLDNSGFCRNNYLVDKYPKINLDKIQIIHNFIVIQSSLLFLYMHLPPMHPYFKH